MSPDHSEHEAIESAKDGPIPAIPLHPKSFKLRFASQRDLGRSYVSAVKPLRLPAVVRAKFYRRETEDAADTAREEIALRRVRDMFELNPKDKFDSPVTTSHEYGWWWERAKIQYVPRDDRRFNHHIRDSAWLKERLRVLATDASLKRR